MDGRDQMLGRLRRALSAGRRTPAPGAPGVEAEVPALVARFDGAGRECLSWLSPVGRDLDLPALREPTPPLSRLSAAHPEDRGRATARLSGWLDDTESPWLVVDHRAIDGRGEERLARSLFLREPGGRDGDPTVLELTWVAAAGESLGPGGGLGALSDLALRLAAAPPTADVYRLIAEALREVTAAVAVTVSTFDEERRVLVVRALAGGDGPLARLAKLFGRGLVGTELPVPRSVMETMRSRLVSDPMDLHEVSFGVVFRPVSTAIHRSLRVGPVVGLSLLDAGELIGGISVLLPEGRSAPSPEVLRSFAHLAAAAVRRRQAELALRLGEARLRAVTECVSDVIWTVGTDLRYTYVSPSVKATFGYGPEETLGRSLLHTVAPEMREAAERGAERALARLAEASSPTTVALRTQELEQVRKDGSRIWTEVAVSPLLDGSGRLAGLVGVTRDVTARRQAAEERGRLEARLRATQKVEALGRMAAGVAHDFNNLLTVVLANAGLALAEIPPGGAGLASILEVEDAARRAARLARQILAYSGASTFSVRPVDPTELVEGTRELLESALPRERARLELRLERGLPRVRVDATQVREALLALVVNAGEAVAAAPGASGGLVTVSTAALDVDGAALDGACSEAELRAGRYVALSVRDDGVGMDEETLAHLFEPFFTTKFTGRGLGLSAAAGILKGHGGAIRASGSPGEGATVTLLLPAEAAVGDGEAPARATVLVVDDEPALGAVARRMLEAAGCEVLEARSVAEALEVCAAAGERIRVVLLDPTAPRIGGPAAREILAAAPRARAVVMSGLPRELGVAGLGDGEAVAGYVRKPFDGEALLAAVLPSLGR